MSPDDEELSRLLSPLRGGPVALDDQREELELRERLMPALRAQVAALPLERLRAARVRRVRRIAAVSTGLALAAAMLLGLRGALVEQQPGTDAGESRAWLEVEPSSRVSDASFVDASGRTRALPSGSIEASSLRELRSGTHETRVRTSEGAALRIAAKSRLGVRTERGNARLRLLDGEVDCSVPKLGAASFAIDTPDARVVVHGTRFSVRVRDAAEARTCVRVQEGIVAVHYRKHEREQSVRLLAGDQWGCDSKPVTEPRVASPRPARAALRKQSDAEPSEIVHGTLGEENRLLSEALGAERNNDRAAARRLFRQLLDRYPSSPLARDAALGLERTR